MYGALLTAATGACWPKARVAGQPHVDLDDSCVRHGAVRDDSFHQIWSCPVINAIPHDNIRNSQHLFQRAKREKNTSLCFLDQRHGPSRMDGGASSMGCGRTTREAQFLRYVEGVG